MSDDFGLRALDILERLNPTSITDYQVEMNQFLTGISNARAVFFVWMKLRKNSATVNVIGNHILPAQLSFPIQSVEELWSKPSAAGMKSFIDTVRSSLSSVIEDFPDSLSVVPVWNNFDGDKVQAVVCFVECTSFDNCKRNIEKCLRYTRGTLLAAFSLWEERERRKTSQELLSLVDYIYLNLGDLRDLLQRICKKACKLLGADTCILYLVTPDGNFLMGKVIAGVHLKTVETLKIPVMTSISGQALCTGDILIFEDAWKHLLYCKMIEEFVGDPAKNMMVFPIRDSWNRVVGVAAAINKAGFTRSEMEVAATLSTHFGMSLVHNLIHKRILQTHARLRNYKELIIYHQTVNDEEIQFVLCNKDHVDDHLSDWKWVCREVSPEAMPRLAMQMFESLDFIKSCRMRRPTLCRFILLVRKNYRPVSYHNWMHAFSVANFAFCLMKSLELIGNSLITELEGVALLVALLCHDLDHRGTTNAFQSVSRTVLASLYESEGSIMERHHLAMTLRLLCYPGCNVFEGLDAIAYRRVVELIKVVIIATDLGVHLSNLSVQRAIINKYDSNIVEHRSRFLALIASSSDMNDQAKGWRNSKEAAIAVYSEFFAQGDLEKQMGLTPMAMMDREKAEIPNLQVQFITDICMPMYRMLASVSPSMKALIASAEETIECWKRAQVWFSRIAPEARVGIAFLNEPSLEIFINKGI